MKKLLVSSADTRAYLRCKHGWMPMTGRSTGRICVAALVFAACSLGAASAAAQEFRHGQMVVLDQTGLVNQLLPLGISLTGNAGGEIVVLEGLVEGTQLSIGVSLTSNRWSLPAEHVDKAFVGAPHDFCGTMAVTAKLYSASNEPLQSEVVRLEWARGGGAIPPGNPVRSRAGVDPVSGVRAADAAPLAPSQASPPLTSASEPIAADNPSPSATAAEADSPASAVSVPETKSLLETKDSLQGADRPASRMYTKAPPPAPVLFTWSGFYIGLNVGGKWANTDGHVDVAGESAGLGSTTNSTAIVGGQIGYNWQTPGSPWVFGVEADGDAQHWKNSFGVNAVGPPTIRMPSTPSTPVPIAARSLFAEDPSIDSHWQASVRGRIGYAWDRILLYATGGVAFTHVETSTAQLGFPFTDDKTIVGGTVGGGVEYAITNNISLGVEGRSTFYGDHTFNIGSVGTSPPSIPIPTTPPTPVPTAAGNAEPVTNTIKLNAAEVMGKINFHF